jgi:MFS family permease
VVIAIGTRPIFESHTRQFLMAGFLLSAICDVLYTTVHTRWQLFAIQVVLGLGTGLIEPAWDALFTEDAENSTARHWSLWAGGTHLATGAAAIIGGLMVSYWSFKVLFLTMAAVDLVALYVTWHGMVKDQPAASQPRTGA